MVGQGQPVDPDSLAGESLTPDALEDIIESSMAVVREALRIELRRQRTPH
jgi:hypothetical protein